MQDKLRAIEDRYETLTEDMGRPDVLADYQKLQELAKERSHLEKVVSIYRELRGMQEQAAEARTLVNGDDEEMAALAQEELTTLEPRIEQLEQDLKLSLLPPDPHDDRNVIVEIRGGTGGEEAALFASELYRMYSRYAEKKRWQVEILSSSGSEKGGFKEIVFEVDGKGAYSRLKYESGGHRVQRVPETEAQGRIHTSTSTVAVLPEAEEIEVDIDEKDVQTDIYHSGGAGGQNVNKVATAVRLTHLPTGIVVQCQDERSQGKNRVKAMNVLRSRLLAIREAEQASEIAGSRKAQVGTGERAEKIRTYNFPQDRITDHRIGFTRHGLPSFMDGDIDDVIDAVATAEQARRLEEDLIGMTSLRAAWLAARDRLRAANIDDADFEAELLLRHAIELTGARPVTRAALYARFEDDLGDATPAYETLLVRRLAHEPSAYILGRREFRGLDFEVTPAVLIPRPETETLVEAMIHEANRLQPRQLRLADIGTGSGAIAVALAKELPGAEIYATDVSKDAIAIAKGNARRHGVEGRIRFSTGHLLTPHYDYVDLIAANLPYVTTGDWECLPPELREHEPRLALDGGTDGLDLIRELLSQAPHYLRPGGAVCLEIGAEQSGALSRFVENRLPGAECSIEPDLEGRPRVFVVRPNL